jgi:hypothetical protein
VGQVYARVVGVTLLLLGETCLLSVGTTNPAVDLDHLFVALFSPTPASGAGTRDSLALWSAGWGIYLLAFLPALVLSPLFGVFPHTPNGILLNHLVHLVVGVSSVAAVAYLSQDALAKLLGR